MPKFACANSGRAVTRWMRSVSVEFDWARAMSTFTNTNKNVHSTHLRLFFKFKPLQKINCAWFHEPGCPPVKDGLFARTQLPRVDAQIISAPKCFGKRLI